MPQTTDASGARTPRERSAQRLTGFPLPAFGGLPIGEADLADDVVDVVYDAFDHDGGVGGAGLLEEFGEGGFAAVFIFSRGDFFSVLTSSRARQGL
jgi:hypothetical protein